MRDARSSRLLLTPGLVWLLVFFALPIAGVLATSFLAWRPGGGIEWAIDGSAWRRLLDPVYGRVFARSIAYAAANTAICFAAGYPLALLLVRLRPGARTALLFLLVLPLWMSFLLKAYSWIFVLGREGLAGRLFGLDILYTKASVFLGLATGYLPFMVLPLYVSLDRLDPSLEWASMDLGAGRLRTFVLVKTRLILPGIVAGSILVFVPTLGEFVIPDLLGGGKLYLAGNLIKDQFLGAAPNWPLGAAFACTVIAVTTGAIAIGLRAQEARRDG